MLVSLALGDANFSLLPDAKPKSYVLPDAKPQRKPVEYRLCWVPTQNPNASQWNIGCVGSQRKIWALVMYISLFLVSISFALGPVFQWNMGFTVTVFRQAPCQVL